MDKWSRIRLVLCSPAAYLSWGHPNQGDIFLLLRHALSLFYLLRLHFFPPLQFWVWKLNMTFDWPVMSWLELFWEVFVHKVKNCERGQWIIDSQWDIVHQIGGDIVADGWKRSFLGDLSTAEEMLCFCHRGWVAEMGVGGWLCLGSVQGQVIRQLKLQNWRCNS